MEYGKLPDEALEHFDYSLPPNPPANAKVLPGLPSTHKMYMGCPQWGIDDWVGQLYPKGTKQGDYLEHYAKHYNTIEFNTVHYRLPDDFSLVKWRQKVEGKDFKFCPKFLKDISHTSKFDPSVKELSDAYISKMR